MRSGRVANPEITKLLNAWKTGDRQAADRLFDLLYADLHKMVGKILATTADAGRLQTTELIHETYMKLLDQKSSWENRGHFFAIAARVIRRIVVDHVRRKQCRKRGGEEEILPLDQVEEPRVETVDWLVLDQALTRLAGTDEVAAKVVELRYFAGMSLDEVAPVLGIGRATAVRHWRFARAWLKYALENKPSIGGG